jgi:hypothetical protein
MPKTPRHLDKVPTKPVVVDVATLEGFLGGSVDLDVKREGLIRDEKG